MSTPNPLLVLLCRFYLRCKAETPAWAKWLQRLAVANAATCAYLLKFGETPAAWHAMLHSIGASSTAAAIWLQTMRKDEPTSNAPGAPDA